MTPGDLREIVTSTRIARYEITIIIMISFAVHYLPASIPIPHFQSCESCISPSSPVGPASISYYERIEFLIFSGHSNIFGSMSRIFLIAFTATLSIFVSPVWSASSSCSTSVTATNGLKPSVASGYQVALVATGLTNPRSIQFDTLGNLLVLQDGAGIANLVFQDDGGTCLSVKSTRNVIKYKDVSVLPVVEALPHSPES